MASLGAVAAGSSSHLLPSSATRRTTTSTHVSLSSSSSSSSLSVKSLRSSSVTPLPSLFISHQKVQRRSFKHRANVSSSVVSPTSFASDPDQLKSAREDIKELLKTTFCHPIMELYQ